MGVAAEACVLGTAPFERERLLAQASFYEVAARRLFEELGARPAWRALDVGCGSLGILPLLAEYAGEVTGLEPEADFAAAARVALSERGLAGLAVLHGDPEDARLPRAGFDLVHARLVLMVTRGKARLLEQMVALTRPGGTVVVQDLDLASFACDPPHPAWTRLVEACHAAYRERGLDPFVGRRLAGLLRTAGLTQIDMRVHTHASVPGEVGQSQLLEIVERLRDPIVDAGLLSAEALQDACAVVRAHLARAGTVVLQPVLVQAWGRVPA